MVVSAHADRPLEPDSASRGSSAAPFRVWCRPSTATPCVVAHWKSPDATKFSRGAQNFDPIQLRKLPAVELRRGSRMASKRTEIVIEQIIAACDGDVHGAA